MNQTLTKVLVNNKVLDLFGKAVSSTEVLSFEVVNSLAVKLGYLVHPDACNTQVLLWLESKKMDLGSTFYKSWSDIIVKDRFELFIDQLRHYASTYGTNFTGPVFLPEGESVIPELTKLKVILPITIDEVISRCEKMLFSGIALKQETLTSLLDILTDFEYKIDVDKVMNKEAKMILCKTTGALPSDPVEMVRYLVYLVNNKTLLIKDAVTLNTIKASRMDVSKLIEAFGMQKLSSVFFRFKPIFLAFRSSFPNRKVINKLRKLADDFHKPMKLGYFEGLLSGASNVAELPKMLEKINNFKKVNLLQTINIRLKELDNRTFVVRNQKLFIKTGDKPSINKGVLKLISYLIYESLVKSLKAKACKINLPKGVNLTLPTSEKSFVGNYPSGTSFDFSESDNIVGINWRGEDGASDLDLSLMSIDGTKYGWNAAYKNSNNSILYSGDMTSANPEATELYYASKNFKPAIVKVNSFYAAKDSKFKFFIAKEKITKMDRNYMVDPNNLLFVVDSVMDSEEKSLGVITENKFILSQFRTGRGRVSRTSVTDLYTDYALSTIDCYISLEKLLVDAGFEITDKNPDLDLTELSKDSLISLINKD